MLRSSSSGQPVEHDFFLIEKENSLSPAPPPLRPTKSSSSSPFKNIQRMVSKLNPEVVKSVIASAAVGVDVDCRHSSSSSSQPGASKPTSPPVLPTPLPTNNISLTASRNFSAAEIGDMQMVSAPMTIFYNGNVTVFDVTPHQAKNILQVAQQGFSKIRINSDPSPEPDDLLKGLKGVPMARRKSLEHFLEKRKERCV